ncbi:MAG: helix-turn-helix domain-containing protein [Methylocystis sp.]
MTTPHGSAKEPGMLTLTQAAERIGVCERRFRDILRTGDIPYVNLGDPGKRTAYRFMPADIDAFLLQRRTTWQKPEVSTSAPAPARGSTTSNAGVIDFVARLARKTAEKPKPASKSSGRKSKPKSRS